MTYLVDSDGVAEWLLGRQPVGTELTALKRVGISISAITFMELFEGVIGSQDSSRNRRVFRSFLRGARLLVVGRPIAERAALIRLDLRRQKRPVDHRAMDILIAATATACARSTAPNLEKMIRSRALTATSEPSAGRIGTRQTERTAENIPSRNRDLHSSVGLVRIRVHAGVTNLDGVRRQPLEIRHVLRQPRRERPGQRPQ